MTSHAQSESDAQSRRVLKARQEDDFPSRDLALAAVRKRTGHRVEGTVEGDTLRIVVHGPHRRALTEFARDFSRVFDVVAITSTSTDADRERATFYEPADGSLTTIGFGEVPVNFEEMEAPSAEVAAD